VQRILQRYVELGDGNNLVGIDSHAAAGCFR
jgi:hypothetical protein